METASLDLPPPGHARLQKIPAEPLPSLRALAPQAPAERPPPLRALAPQAPAESPLPLTAAEIEMAFGAGFPFDSSMFAVGELDANSFDANEFERAAQQLLDHLPPAALPMPDREQRFADIPRPTGVSSDREVTWDSATYIASDEFINSARAATAGAAAAGAAQQKLPGAFSGGGALSKTHPAPRAPADAAAERFLPPAEHARPPQASALHAPAAHARPGVRAGDTSRPRLQRQNAQSRFPSGSPELPPAKRHCIDGAQSTSAAQPVSQPAPQPAPQPVSHQTATSQEGIAAQMAILRAIEVLTAAERVRAEADRQKFVTRLHGIICLYESRATTTISAGVLQLGFDPSAMSFADYLTWRESCLVGLNASTDKAMVAIRENYANRVADRTTEFAKWRNAIVANATQMMDTTGAPRTASAASAPSAPRTASSAASAPNAPRTASAPSAPRTASSASAPRLDVSRAPQAALELFPQLSAMKRPWSS
jgi:hypothetical protein